jgi:hypothetical protein
MGGATLLARGRLYDLRLSQQLSSDYYTIIGDIHGAVDVNLTDVLVANGTAAPCHGPRKAQGRAYASAINATVAYGAHINARPKICTIVHTVLRWS